MIYAYCDIIFWSSFEQFVSTILMTHNMGP